MSLKIENIFAYEVLDSRGNPTVACIAKISSGLFNKKFFSAKAMVPSGASTGIREALELRDGDKGRYGGKGVKKAVHYVNYVIATSLIENNIDPSKQESLDNFLIELDGTENKSRYGANAILSVSLALAKAVAKAKLIPFYQYVAYLVGNEYPKKFILPLPMVNVINGGAHADNTIDFQEFMFMPVGASSIHEAVRISSECFHSLQKVLSKKGMNTNKGDEGGFAPNLKSNEEVLDTMIEAIKEAGYKPGVVDGQVALALDVAASELYDKEKKEYTFKKALQAGLMSKTDAVRTTSQMIDYYEGLVMKYPIISIEDPLDESDWDGFVEMNSRLGDRLQIVGDDLFCTNPKITQEGVEKKVANAVLVKMNQIGTISETLRTIQIAKNAGWTCILSHRSGETEDSSIADIAVGTSAGQIKTGSVSRSERVAKYNRLMEIEIELTAANSVFYGINSLFSLDFSNSELFKTKSFVNSESTSSSQPRDAGPTDEVKSKEKPATAKMAKIEPSPINPPKAGEPLTVDADLSKPGNFELDRHHDINEADKAFKNSETLPIPDDPGAKSAKESDGKKVSPEKKSKK